jgi:hypothetical protein
MMAAFTGLVTSHRSSTSTIQLTPATRVKVEKDEELITILNDDSDGNLPAVVPPNGSPLVNSSLQNSIERTPTLINNPPPYIGYQQSLSVVDSLKRLQASKRARNAFRSLEYNNLDI